MTQIPGPAATSSPPSVRPREVNRATLPVVLLALATVISAVSSLMTALPTIARETGAGQTEMTWIVDAYNLAFAALLLPAGALGDRWGRRRVLLIGLIVFAVASFVPLVSSDPTVLIVVRAMLGAAAALVMPATLSTITSAFPARERVRAVATWAGVAGAGAVLGLFVTGLVLQWWSWPAVFVASGVMALVTVLGVMRWVPETAAPQEASADLVGALLSVLGVGTLVYAVIEAPRHDWSSARTLILIAVGALLIAAFLGWENRVARPLLAPRYFKLSGFSTGSLSLAMQFFAFFGFLMVFMQQLQLLRGLSALEAALAILPLPLGLMPAARGLAPRLSRVLPQPLQSALGLAVMALAMAWLGLVDVNAPYWQLGVGLWVLGLGAGTSMPPATSAITESLPTAEQGVASAVNDLSRELGGAIGIAVLSSVLASGYRSHLDLSLVPASMRGLVEESGLAAMGMPMQEVARMASEAYQSGIQYSLLVAAGAVLVSAVVLLLLGRGSRPGTMHEPR